MKADSFNSQISEMGVIAEGRGENRPLSSHIDVSLTVEKEMTAALTGQVMADHEKIIQQASNKLTLVVTREGSSEVETIVNYVCEKCDKSFYLSNRYKLHCLEEHGITHPYTCQLCEKRYTTESGMKVHLRTHKNQKPHVCKECGKPVFPTLHICFYGRCLLAVQWKLTRNHLVSFIEMICVRVVWGYQKTLN